MLRNKIGPLLPKALLWAISLSPLWLVVKYQDPYYLVLVIFLLPLAVLISFPNLDINTQFLHLPVWGKKIRNMFSGLENRSFKKRNLSDIKVVDFLSKYWLIFVSSVIAFTSVAFFFMESDSFKNSLIIDYYVSFLGQFNLLGVVILTFFVLLVLLSWVFYKDLWKNMRLLILTFLSSCLLGFIVSFPILFLVATLHKNYLVYQIRSSDRVVWGAESIDESIKQMESPPKVVNAENDFQSKLVEAYVNDEIWQVGDFYKKRLYPSAPKVFSKINTNKENVVLVNDVLLFKELSREEVEEISGSLGRLYVKSYLENRYVKSEPKVSVLGRQEYLSYREDQINERISELKDVYSEFKAELSYLYSTISEAKQKIALNKASLENSISERQSAYEYCVNAGYYSAYFNYFYRYYSDEECQREWNKWTVIIQGFQKNINDWQNTLSWANSQVPVYKETLDYIDFIIGVNEDKKDLAVYELGLFEPEDNIKIALDYTSSATLADYLSTLVHEYYHYTSYVSEEKILPLFFEEGLTEYFARKSVEQELEVSTNLGYPVIVKVVDKMVDDLGEDRLKEYYLTKNEDGLISALNAEYGDSFYEDNELYFYLLTLLPPQEQLKIANNIMVRIGGEQIELEDAISSETEI